MTVYGKTKDVFCEWAETVQTVHRPAVLSRAAQARVSEVTVMLVAMLVRLFAHGSAANTAFARKSSAADAARSAQAVMACGGFAMRCFAALSTPWS